MKIKLYSLLFIATVFGGCQKLDRELVTDLGPESIEGNRVQTLALLNGLYGELREGFTEIGSNPAAGSAMMASVTDEADHSAPYSPANQINNGIWNPYTNPAGVWESYYRGIRRINYFLEVVGKVSLERFELNPSESGNVATYRLELNRWPFEARFLRAFYYFELLKRYGGVPLLRSTTINLADVKRNTFEECVSFIVDECNAVAASADIPLNYVAADTDFGRANRLAALALKSRVLLYAASPLFNTATPYLSTGSPESDKLICYGNADPNRWKLAADAAKAAIDALPNLTLADYRATFGNGSSPNIIFGRRNSPSNLFEAINLPVGFQNVNTVGFPGGGNCPSQNLVDDYEIVVPGNTAEKFSWSNPDHVNNIYSASGTYKRDPRLFASVVVNNSTYQTNNTRPVQLWEGGLDGLPKVNASTTGYYLRKYVNENINLPLNGTAVHGWVYFRKAELFLNYAEALNEFDYTTFQTDALDFLNRVRRRTGVAMPDVPSNLGQVELRRRIRNERRVEFAFEDHRAWDTRRWLTAETDLGGVLRGVRVVRNQDNTFSYTQKNVENRIFDRKMFLYPIPISEVTIQTGGLKQNPGW